MAEESVVFTKMEFASEAKWIVKEVTKNKSDGTQEVISVARKFLGIRDVTPEELYKYMLGVSLANFSRYVYNITKKILVQSLSESLQGKMSAVILCSPG